MTTLDRTEQLDILVNGLGARRMPIGDSSLLTIKRLGRRIFEVLDEIDTDLAHKAICDRDRGADVDCPHEPRNNHGRFLSLDVHFCKPCWLAFRYQGAEGDHWKQLRILVDG